VAAKRLGFKIDPSAAAPNPVADRLKKYRRDICIRSDSKAFMTLSTK
jgi:hypothetical protein